MTLSQYKLITSLVAVLSVLSSTETMRAQYAAKAPKVVVNIVIDQLRDDYLQAFMPLYEPNGFRRLLKEGKVYAQAESASYEADRAASIANIMTGSSPSQHGIVALQWLNRTTLQPIFCVEDASHNGSPQHLQLTTLGDELKMATAGRSQVYAIAPFKDAAILSAGHAGDGAFWIDENTGLWSSSDFYGQMPTWVSTNNSALEKLQNTTWTPVNARVGSYCYFLSKGKRKPFAHQFEGLTRYQDFNTSGLVNDAVAQTAQEYIETSTFGLDDYTDLLSITFYAGTYKNLRHEEAATELQDAYVRIDRAISNILRSIEHKTGLKNAIITFTSTGTATHSDDADLGKYRIPSGTVDIERNASLLNMYLGAIYGSGKYVDAIYRNHIYLNHKLIEDKQLLLSDILYRSKSFLLQLSGINEVYTAENLLQGAWSPTLSKKKKAFNVRNSGDIWIEITPGWTYTSSNDYHSQQQRVNALSFPIVFFGHHITPEITYAPVSVDIIAPTLSSAMRIRAPNGCKTKAEQL